MPVRVKLEIKSEHGNIVVTTLALVNTGFTSDNPDLAIPVALAEKLNLWPRPPNAIAVSLETGGGVIESYIIPQTAAVKIITNDRTSREVVVNIIVNPFIDEVLISDALAEELGIQILYPRRGLWKFADESRTRESESVP